MATRKTQGERTASRLEAASKRANVRSGIPGSGEKHPRLRALLKQAEREREVLTERLAPKKAKLAALENKLQPLLAEQRKLGREIRESQENQKLGELDIEIGGLARALGGYALTDNDKPAE
jgi:hypothetical protein